MERLKEAVALDRIIADLVDDVSEAERGPKHKRAARRRCAASHARNCILAGPPSPSSTGDGRMSRNAPHDLDSDHGREMRDLIARALSQPKEPRP